MNSILNAKFSVVVTFGRHTSKVIMRNVRGVNKFCCCNRFDESIGTSDTLNDAIQLALDDCISEAAKDIIDMDRELNSVSQLLHSLDNR